MQQTKAPPRKREVEQEVQAKDVRNEELTESTEEVLDALEDVLNDLDSDLEPLPDEDDIAYLDRLHDLLDRARKAGDSRAADIDERIKQEIAERFACAC